MITTLLLILLGIGVLFVGGVILYGMVARYIAK